MSYMFPKVTPLPGEQMDVAVASPMDAADAVAVLYPQHDKAGSVEVRCCSLLLSSYRLILGVAGAVDALAVPLMSIHTWKATTDTGPARDAFRAAKQRAARTGASAAAAPQTLVVVTITTKHVWTHTIAFPAESKMLLRSIQHHLSACGRIQHIQRLPAFAIGAAATNAPATAGGDAMSTTDFGWNIYSREREFARQLCLDPSSATPSLDSHKSAQACGVGVGMDLRPWFHLETIDKSAGPAAYTNCPTYPTAVLVPNVVSRSVVLAALSARSRARIPAITYVHLSTGAVLARASQPLGGSSNLGADATLCAALANVAYPAANTIANEKAKVPLAQAVTTSSSPAAAAPPSLFEQEEEGNGGGGLKGRDIQKQRLLQTVPHTATSPASPQQQQQQRQQQQQHRQATPSASPSAPLQLMVADCRPWVAATANAAFGGGYESGPLYDSFCNTQFFEIDNVFGVAKSFAKLRALVLKYQGESSKHTRFWRDLEDTEWFTHIQRVLACSVAVARSLRRGVSALVHCTDGWDRTSQCCATAALLLDPFYRTTVGFCILLEKDFCHFGHKFAERSDHQVDGRTRFEVSSGVASSDTEKPKSSGNGGGSGSGGGNGAKLQPSPIFTQYMDVVYQVVHQFPHAFEFTPALLAFLSEAVFSCFFGTFLGNCEQERRLEGVELATQSLWTFVLRRVQEEKAGKAPLHFVNDSYDAATAWAGLQKTTTDTKSGRPMRSQQGEADMLVPSTSPKRMRFWSELYCKWDVSQLDEEREEREEEEGEDEEADEPRGPHRAPSRTRVVSWGTAFDAFLQKYIDDACASRVASEKHLKELEAHFAKEPRSCGGSRRISEWCAFDPSICYNCLKSIGMFSALNNCDSCGHGYCANCMSTHQCVGRHAY